MGNVATSMRSITLGHKEYFKVTEVNVCRKFDEHDVVGQQLKLESIPDAFITRYGATIMERPIYIRRCYTELYEIATKLLLENPNNHPNILFTGVPGIGKSMFLIYFVYRYLSDNRFPIKSFAVEFRLMGEYDYYRRLNDGSFIRSSTKYNLPKNVPVFTDMNATDGPGRDGRCTLIFSSPNPLRHKEAIKYEPSRTYTVPTWSYEELLFIGPSDDSWHEKFVIYGGVPRSIFSENSQFSFESAMKSAGSRVAKNIFSTGLGDKDTEMNYMLIHINPPSSLEGDFLYDKFPVYSFASDYIFKELSKLHKKAILSQATTILNSGVSQHVYGGTTAGLYFEKILLWLIPIATQRIKIERLSSNSMETTEYLFYTLPPMKCLDYNWKNSLKESNTSSKRLKTSHNQYQSQYQKVLEPGVLYQPPISNLESGDAFCVVQEKDKSYSLLVLQITIAESHPVKVNGLRNIVLSFGPDMIFGKKLLVFVTPPESKLHRPQPLITQDGKNATKLPEEVKDFQQYICTISISSKGKYKLIQTPT